MRPTAPKITRRSRRRNRGKDKFVWWHGAWMQRTITVEHTVLSDGSTIELQNETWHEPGGVLAAYRRQINPL